MKQLINKITKVKSCDDNFNFIVQSLKFNFFLTGIKSHILQIKIQIINGGRFDYIIVKESI
jgi:hypothetical protein